jgi:hypothetical protein
MKTDKDDSEKIVKPLPQVGEETEAIRTAFGIWKHKNRDGLMYHVALREEWGSR